MQMEAKFRVGDWVLLKRRQDANELTSTVGWEGVHDEWFGYPVRVANITWETDAPTYHLDGSSVGTPRMRALAREEWILKTCEAPAHATPPAPPAGSGLSIESEEIGAPTVVQTSPKPKAWSPPKENAVQQQAKTIRCLSELADSEIVPPGAEIDVDGAVTTVNEAPREVVNLPPREDGKNPYEQYAEEMMRRYRESREPGERLPAAPPGSTATYTGQLPPVEAKKNLNVPGAKDDHGKEPVGMMFEYFPRALLNVAKVAGFGAKKYTRGGWISVPDAEHRYDDALGRHLLKRHIEGPNDLESELKHLAHAAWNALAILELALRGEEK